MDFSLRKWFSRVWWQIKGWQKVKGLTFSALHPAVFVRAIPEADLICSKRCDIRFIPYLYFYINSVSTFLIGLLVFRWSFAGFALTCDGGQRFSSPQSGGSRHGQLCASAGPRGRRWVLNSASSMGFTGPVSVFDVGFPPSAAPVSVGRRVQGQKISWWEGQKGLAFLQDVQLVDGELVVPWPGLYYVYAQTYFRHTHSLEETEEEGGEDGDRGRPLLQYVYKKVSIWFNYYSDFWLCIYFIKKNIQTHLSVCHQVNSYQVPILLMKTSQTSCWSRGSQFSLHSAHQGGLFPLGSGDRLFVTVTNATAVDMDEKSSFFGAFLVS